VRVGRGIQVIPGMAIKMLVRRSALQRRPPTGEFRRASLGTWTLHLRPGGVSKALRHGATGREVHQRGRGHRVHLPGVIPAVTAISAHATTLSFADVRTHLSPAMKSQRHGLTRRCPSSPFAAPTCCTTAAGRPRWTIGVPGM